MIWKVPKHSIHVPLVGLLSLALFLGTTFADQRGLNQPHVIEVFTSTEYSLVHTDAKVAGSESRGLEIVVYEIDGIQAVERDLSLDLPAETEPSRRMALQRIQSLDEQARAKMQSAAHGMARALQYGIDRFPAIVFDGQAVVYGITDMPAAIAHYQTWRTGRQR